MACEYCNYPYHDLLGLGAGDYDHGVYYEDALYVQPNMLEIHSEGQYIMSDPINYCPMCGRKLEE